VELADGTVAMILKTAGLGNPESEAGLCFRPRRVKVLALLRHSRL
jgi:hypothetical protein